MSKSLKDKKSKVPRITEAEYAAYISSLKSGEEKPPAPPTTTVSLKNQEAERLEN